MVFGAVYWITCPILMVETIPTLRLPHKVISRSLELFVQLNQGHER
jgi:hypothetical protein